MADVTRNPMEFIWSDSGGMGDLLLAVHGRTDGAGSTADGQLFGRSLSPGANHNGVGIDTAKSPLLTAIGAACLGLSGDDGPRNQTLSGLGWCDGRHRRVAFVAMSADRVLGAHARRCRR
jgi:hypothetical protein